MAISKGYSVQTAWLVVAVFAGVLTLLMALGRLPAMVLALYALASLVLFIVYWLDKRAAERNRRRTPETLLHKLALVGGWPGALLAQQLFRHKSSKVPFRRMFWGTVVLNLVLLGLLLSPYGHGVVRVLQRLWS